jgi:hypothetical protein
MPGNTAPVALEVAGVLFFWRPIGQSLPRRAAPRREKRRFSLAAAAKAAGTSMCLFRVGVGF